MEEKGKTRAKVETGTNKKRFKVREKNLKRSSTGQWELGQIRGIRLWNGFHTK